MNKNEPIIINKAGDGYLVKPLSYVFDDSVAEDNFKVFTNMTAVAVWMKDHFETQLELSVKTEERTHTGVVTDKTNVHTAPVRKTGPSEKLDVISDYRAKTEGGKNVGGTEQSNTSKTEK